MLLFELKKQSNHALSKAEAIVAASERENRALTDSEVLEYENAMAAVNALKPRIRGLESKNTLGRHMINGVLIPSGSGGKAQQPEQAIRLSDDYPDAFYEYVRSNGKKMDAALYEGSNPAGGYAVPVVVSDQIVPLAPNELAVRQLAQVLATSSDIKFPQKAAFGTAAAKAENSAFGGTQPVLSQITLSAFMAGIQEVVSWELAQDVPAFQTFCVTDMIDALQMYEENLFINGTGSGEAQGLVSNVGAGGTYEADGNGNLVTIDGTLQLTGTLNALYHGNASWLMSRQTAITLRKAQQESNLFIPAFTRVGNQDFLHGYPVYYSASMASATRGAAPILFGDFKRGYVIGDRGGNGINVKVLDQPLATQGQIVLLAYRRTDGRVRRSEAIQQYNIAAS